MISPPPPEGWLSPREERVVEALAAAAIPAGAIVPPGSRDTVERLRAFLAGWPRSKREGVRALFWAVELSSLATRGRPLSALSRDEAEVHLRRWSGSGSLAWRSVLRAALAPVKSAHFDDPRIFERARTPYRGAAVVHAESPRWLERVTDGRTTEDDLDLECEVVVVGTGAGGAAAAYELASRGRAVLLLEEGHYHRRGELDGRASKAVQRMYRDQGVTLALGNTTMPVFTGRAVGGSTVINSGTCYRAEEKVFRGWRGDFGLPADFSERGLAPYYERVESMLGVAPADPRYLGGVARIIARGCDALGYEHHPLARNAPGCDGQGMCCYGCPTGAKRSTDVSYVPAALTRGAELVTGAKVERVDVVAGRARGVVGRLASGRRLRVRAGAVVVAGGTLMSPILLRRSGACRTSGQLGKNLSVHPATNVFAVFDELVDMGSAIPQGYAIESFRGEDMLFEGSSLPLDILAVDAPLLGRELTALVDAYRHIASFGFMIKDESRGVVREGPGGSPLLTYRLGARDAALLHRGIGLLAEVYFAAGARTVHPLVHGHQTLRGPADLARLRAARIGPGDLELGAFHPLGTVRMGTSAADSCVGPTHEAHDVEGLYVCDGSVIPSSLGVNPQLTIMAMALRAAEGIARRL